MLTLYNSARKPVILDRQVARGGQGAVYSVAGQPGMLGKLYVPKPQDGQDDKLRWMLAHTPPDPSAPDHASIAWPRDLLLDSQGHFLGYLMPFVQDGVPILRVFNPRSRAATMPGFGRRYQFRAALNLTRSLRSLHEHDYIVGDLNESNVLVTRRAMVTIIDTDSFQVQEPKEGRIIVYPCPVGKPEYTAPELQGQAFSGILRRWEHDVFALGVLIWQLLMEGNHPYRARWSGPGDPPSLSERIQRGMFPYGSTAIKHLAPAPGVPPLNSLPSDVVELFRRCFEGNRQSNERPTALEWEAALQRAERISMPFSSRVGAIPPAGKTPQSSTGRGASQPKGPAGPASAQPKPPRPQQPSWGQQLLLSSGQLLNALMAKRSAQRPTTARGRVFSLAAQALAAMLTGNAGQSVAGASPGGPRVAGSSSAPAPPQTFVACPQCGEHNSPDEIYCQACAYPLAGTRPCPRCGKPMPRNTRYCTHCASRV